MIILNQTFAKLDPAIIEREALRLHVLDKAKLASVYRFWDWFDQYHVHIVTLTNTLQEEIGKDLLHQGYLIKNSYKTNRI